jgi:hypothetical protein
MNDEKRKINSETFTVKEAVNALINSLREAGYDEFNYEIYRVKYHLDVGLLVLIESTGVPDFPIDTRWLIDSSGLGWMLHAMEQRNLEDLIYDCVFLLEVDI